MNRVFVYGTLMPSQWRWPFLSPYADGPPRRASVRGVLLDTGAGYPALVKLDATDRIVQGCLVDLLPASTTDAVATLDRIEGTAVGLYARRRTATLAGETCCTYTYELAVDGMADLEGSWELRRQRDLPGVS